jgi:lipoyl(octanoyl) transferase
MERVVSLSHDVSVGPVEPIRLTDRRRERVTYSRQVNESLLSKAVRETAEPISTIAVLRRGMVEYGQAWDEQRQLHADRVAGVIDDTLVLLEHPSVYTAGRRTDPTDRPLDGTPVIDVDRGGKITWHGPGQLVGYPIVRLPDAMDVVGHVRRLESAIIRVCATLGLATTRVAGRSGVWVLGDGTHQDRKVAAIGVRVSRGVTMHGFALNCSPDLTAFDRIVPCGIRDAGVTSLTRELGDHIEIHDVIDLVEKEIIDALLGA